MLSRKLSKRVELWQTTNVSDGFGGNTVNETLITSSWASVKTMGVNSRYSKINSSEGVGSSSNGIVIQTRRRNDITINNINQFIKYAGVKYTIQSMPIDVDFKHNLIEFIAVRQELKQVTEISPIV